MYGAARGGHRNIVDFFILKGAHLWDYGMRGAALGGHRELVEYFISKGATSNYQFDWIGAMACAFKGRHFELMEFFKEKIKERG